MGSVFYPQITRTPTYMTYQTEFGRSAPSINKMMPQIKSVYSQSVQAGVRHTHRDYLNRQRWCKHVLKRTFSCRATFSDPDLLFSEVSRRTFDGRGGQKLQAENHNQPFDTIILLLTEIIHWPPS